jgi:hypothetical protein
MWFLGTELETPDGSEEVLVVFARNERRMQLSL